MAIVKTPQTSKLSIKVQTGTNAAGQAVYRTRTYANVKVAALDSDVFEIAEGLAGLQSCQVQSIGRVDDSVLVSQ